MSTMTGASTEHDARAAFRPHRLKFKHTTLTFEYGPAGVIGRIDYKTRPVVRYVGPLDDDTIDALEEVAKR